MPDLFSKFEEFEKVPMADAEVYFLSHLNLGRSEEHLLAHFVKSIPWRQEDVVVWGKKFRQPRLVAWFGDEGNSYTYSGITLHPLKWTSELDEIRAIVERKTEATFNSVLLNYYRDNNDSMGMHSDDEPELGKHPEIASISIGGERTLIFKHKFNSSVEPVRLRLPSGSLLLMKGPTQHYWKHGIRKETQPCGPRVNLTFRRILLPHEHS